MLFEIATAMTAVAVGAAADTQIPTVLPIGDRIGHESEAK